jgi:hypothetical protein
MNYLQNNDLNQLQSLTFELLGRAPHLPEHQLNYIRSRIEDLLIMVRENMTTLNQPNHIDTLNHQENFHEAVGEYQLNEEEEENLIGSLLQTNNNNNIEVQENQEENQENHQSFNHFTRTISDKQYCSLIPDICSICHDNHTFADVSTMDCCGQHIGINCLMKWILRTERPPTCPCCRTITKKYYTYTTESLLFNDDDQMEIDDDDQMEIEIEWI